MFFGVPFIPFMGEDMLIERGPTYNAGGITTLMSVGEEPVFSPIALVTAMSALAGYFLGPKLKIKPLYGAIAGAILGGISATHLTK